MAGKKKGGDLKGAASTLLREEKTIEKEERKIEDLEQKQLESLRALREEVRKDIGPHPLTRITRADIVRSLIGALIGTVGHFAFFYGVELAEKISFVRATSLYVLSAIVAFFFMYYSGFRKVKEVKVMHFIPLRVAVVYVISLIVVVVTLFIFGFLDESSSFIHLYKVVSTTLLLAVLGASTADILGKE
ncbi:DUF2391 family protein [Candidatus Woesearchaeota archaeon]|nr:DUF2391 family protein [Candidatus Woesearchaeota archaeon]